MPRRTLYRNDGLTPEGLARLTEATRLGLCPYHWVPVGSARRVWCGKGVPVGPQDDPAKAAVQTCYWAFHLEPRWSRITDWATVRVQILDRDGGLCVNCQATATEVDHIKEIQDGGAEFDPANLRSLCHRCHARKTAARRRYGPGATVERVLRNRRVPLESFGLSDSRE